MNNDGSHIRTAQSTVGREGRLPLAGSFEHMQQRRPEFATFPQTVARERPMAAIREPHGGASTPKGAVPQEMYRRCLVELEAQRQTNQQLTTLNRELRSELVALQQRLEGEARRPLPQTATPDPRFARPPEPKPLHQPTFPDAGTHAGMPAGEPSSSEMEFLGYLRQREQQQKQQSLRQPPASLQMMGSRATGEENYFQQSGVRPPAPPQVTSEYYIDDLEGDASLYERVRDRYRHSERPFWVWSIAALFLLCTSFGAGFLIMQSLLGGSTPSPAEGTAPAPSQAAPAPEAAPTTAAPPVAN